MVFPDGDVKIGMFDHNTFISPAKDKSLLTQHMLEKASHSQERGLTPLKDRTDILSPIKENRINKTYSKGRLKPMSTASNSQFDTYKKLAP